MGQDVLKTQKRRRLISEQHSENWPCDPQRQEQSQLLTLSHLSDQTSFIKSTIKPEI